MISKKKNSFKFDIVNTLGLGTKCWKLKTWVRAQVWANKLSPYANIQTKSRRATSQGVLTICEFEVLVEAVPCGEDLGGCLRFHGYQTRFKFVLVIHGWLCNVPQPGRKILIITKPQPKKRQVSGSFVY